MGGLGGPLGKRPPRFHGLRLLVENLPGGGRLEGGVLSVLFILVACPTLAAQCRQHHLVFACLWYGPVGLSRFSPCLAASMGGGGAKGGPPFHRLSTLDDFHI